MYHCRTPVLIVPIAASCLLLSPALASIGGAQGGWNGSLASNGNNCMSCHFPQVGQVRRGSVTVLGAPSTYTFNEIYNLTVRVEDPDQTGAGFQISVEDAVGNHVGTLMKGDDGYTRLAPINAGWVTHTRGGVANAVSEWAEMGNAAEFNLQWQAPKSDVGEIMFYLAGNAIDNDGAAFVVGGDTIYLNSKPATAGDTCSDDDCDDGVFCNGAEACQGDQCEPGSEPCPQQECDEATRSCVDCLKDPNCDDGNPCTDDVCAGGACLHENNAVACDDGDPCTAGDQCANGVCAGVECDDGVFCNGAEACQGDQCEPGSEPCPGQNCDEATRSCVDCQVNTECDDGNPCTDDVCAGGACIHDSNEVACDDGDTCTAGDQCVNGVCAGILVEECCATDEDCDDDVFCNGAEACQGDRCEPGTGPCPEQRCDEATEACVDCQVDPECDDENPCTDDVCAGGACIHDDNEVECDDGDACTAADQCVNGVCAGILVEECCATDDECDDMDECTEDTCDRNACRHDPIPDCPAGDDDDNPPPEDDDVPEPTGDGSDQPIPNDDSPTPSLPRRAPCGLFGMITFPALIFGLIGIRSRRRRITIVGLRRRS